MPSSPTTTIVSWDISQLRLSSISLPAARLSLRLHGRSSVPGRQMEPVECWLDTGAPLSVVPFNVHFQTLHWQLVPGTRTIWNGQPCDLGYLDVWLRTQEHPYLRGPLPLLAKFAHSDPPGPPVPLLLGLEFFLAHQAEFNLAPPPRDGRITLP